MAAVRPYGTYAGLENEAVSIRDYNADTILGLLQVEEYARAIFDTADPPLEAAAMDQRIEARLRRQDLLTSDGAPLIHCIIDEGALRRRVGGSTAMQTQLARIIEAADLPKVTIQVVPLEIGGHRGIESNFVTLEFRRPEVNDVICTEGAIGNIYLAT